MVSYQGVRGSTTLRALATQSGPDVIVGQMMAQIGIESLPSYDGGGVEETPSLWTGVTSSKGFMKFVRSLAGGTSVSCPSYFKGSGEFCGIALPWRANACLRTTLSGTPGGVEVSTETAGRGACFLWACSLATTAVAGTATSSWVEFFLGGGEDLTFVGFTGAPIVASGSY